jgi:hypothetical protein
MTTRRNYDSKGAEQRSDENGKKPIILLTIYPVIAQESTKAVSNSGCGILNKK